MEASLSGYLKEFNFRASLFKWAASLTSSRRDFIAKGQKNTLSNTEKENETADIIFDDSQHQLTRTIYAQGWHFTTDYDKACDPLLHAHTRPKNTREGEQAKWERTRKWKEEKATTKSIS